MISFKNMLHGVVFSALFLSSPMFAGAPVDQDVASTPQKVVLVFGGLDTMWHKNVVRLSRDLVKLFWHADNKRDLLKLLITRKFYKDAHAARKKELKKEEISIQTAHGILDQLGKNHPALEKHKQELMEAVNVHKPNQSLMLFVRELQVAFPNTFVMGVATMQDKESFDYTVERMKDDFDTELPFDFAVTVDNGEDVTERDARFYNEIKTVSAEKAGDDAVVIFIDSNEDRVKQAEEAGFEKTIVFKNLKQCKQALQDLGVSVAIEA